MKEFFSFIFLYVLKSTIQSRFEKNSISFLENFVQTYPLFCSGMVTFDLFIVYFLYKRMQTGSLGSELVELQKVYHEMEKALCLEEKERRKLQEHLMEWKLELVKKYELLPDRIKKEVFNRVRVLKNKEK